MSGILAHLRELREKDHVERIGSFSLFLLSLSRMASTSEMWPEGKVTRSPSFKDGIMDMHQELWT